VRIWPPQHICGSKQAGFSPIGEGGEAGLWSVPERQEKLVSQEHSSQIAASREEPWHPCFLPHPQHDGRSKSRAMAEDLSELTENDIVWYTFF